MKKYFIFALIIGILIAPRLGLAATIEEIQAQINTLMAQIKQLQEQLAQAQTTTAVWCHTFNVNLKIGDSGTEVENLIKVLAKEGVLSLDTIKEKYSFDEIIASAVTGFQQKYKDEILTPLGLKYGTGFVGKSTRAKLNSLYGCGATPPPFACVQIDCASDQKTVCPAGLDDRGCPLLCKCVPITPPTVCEVRYDCAKGYTGYDAGQKDSQGCPIIKCIPPTQNQPPVISGVSGPATLKINETGTWTVKASDPEQGILSYSVRWGDENITGLYSAAQRSWSYTQSTTFTHSFSKDGVYNPTFIVTDNQGLSAKTSISVQVGETAAPSITVLSPNGGEVWQAGSTQTIRWSALNFPAGSTIYIELRPSGNNIGGSASKIAVVSPANGYYAWQIPASVSLGQYIIEMYKADQYGNIDPNESVKDVSNAPFSIVAADQPSITVLSPKSGEYWREGESRTISWSGNKSASSYKLTLMGSTFGSFYQHIDTIPSKLISPEQYIWTIPLDLAATDGSQVSYYIRIAAFDSNGNEVALGKSGVFTIDEQGVATPSITVLSPNGGESWVAGNTYTVTWKSTGVNNIILSVAPETSTGGITQCAQGQTISYLPASSGSYNLTVASNMCAGSYKVRIVDYGNSAVLDSSDAAFSIVAGLTNVFTYAAEPSGTLTRGQTYTFSAKASGAPANSFVYFYLQRSDGTMKYNSYILGATDANGNWSMSTTQKITIEGRNGIWVSWVSAGGQAVSNKQYHNVVAAAVGQAGNNQTASVLEAMQETLNKIAEEIKKLSR